MENILSYAFVNSALTTVTVIIAAFAGFMIRSSMKIAGGKMGEALKKFGTGTLFLAVNQIFVYIVGMLNINLSWYQVAVNILAFIGFIYILLGARKLAKVLTLGEKDKRGLIEKIL